MRLFIDSQSRVFRGVAPQGDAYLSPTLTAGTLVFSVSDDDWYNIYEPAWQVAYADGNDLVINPEHSATPTSVSPRQASAQEQIASILSGFLAKSSPSTADFKAVIQALGAGLQPGGWGYAKWGSDNWGGQG